MDTVDDNMTATSAERSASADLAQLMTAARASTVDAMERLLKTTQTGELPQPLPDGTGYLLFVCAGRECAVPLSGLREVLPAVPRAVYLPYSPDWMLGVFPLRNEMLGLVDPVPLLTHRDPPRNGSEDPLRDTPAESSEASATTLALDGSLSERSSGIVPDKAPATALIVGSEERCLAWAVDSVGDIARVQPDELHYLGEHMAHRLPFAHRYVTGVYRPRESDSHIFVLNAEALLTDLLDALDAGGEGHHG